MNSTLANLVSRRDLLIQLMLSDLRESTAETKLGWLWWLLDPILMMLVYTALIVTVLNRRPEIYAPYPVFLFGGLICWKHFSGATMRSSGILASKAGVIKAIPFPIMVLPLSSVLSGLVFFLFGVIILVFAAHAFPNANYSGRLSPLIQVPGLVFFQLMIVSGVSLAISCIGVIVRDLSGFMSHVLRIGFYLSPGLYGSELVEDVLTRHSPSYGGILFGVYMANPFALLMTGYRSSIIFGEFMPGTSWAVLAVESLCILTLGFRMFRYYERRVIKFI